ncbi:MAG: exo-alpha-sialidase [Puniceicoccaceae bacterium]
MPELMFKKWTLPFLSILLGTTGCVSNETPSPIVYTGTQEVSTAADGGLAPAVGTHNIQVYRANRSFPEHVDKLAHTYLHAPNLAYWNERFYLAYLSAPVNEHDMPTDTSFTSSTDGVHWEAPRLLFPAIQLPDGKQTITHQRMVFYVAPNGRLLATAFHGLYPRPNDGSGIGRVVREIYPDGSLGPVFFIRYNQHEDLDADLTEAYPFYEESPDEGFVTACEALLGDRLATAQWWEEDRSEDGFYRVKGKAFSFYRNPEGKVVGIAKDAQASISIDEGETFTRTGFAENLPVNSSKYWAQQTDDGHYVLVFNPTSRLRHPLAVALSEDGRHFGNLLTVHGELPVQRFPGLYKNMGPQYVRGIFPGNGNPPGDDLWLTYSVNKEDIWVSRVPVPVNGTVQYNAFKEDFESFAEGGMPVGWNVYRPLWAPVEVHDTQGQQEMALRLSDADPYDYAAVTKVFPRNRSALIRFKVKPSRIDGRLEIDVVGPNGGRPVQIALTEEGKIEARHEGIWKPGGTYEANRWTEIEIDVNPDSNTERFQLRVDGKEVLYRIAYFTDFIPEVERLVFRTGKYRHRGDGGHELPGSDRKATLQTYLIDDVSIESRP